MTLGRVHDRGPAGAVGQALRLIPEPLTELVACEFMIGVDPLFAGIHRYEALDVAQYGIYSYRDTAHCVQDYHQSHRPRADRGIKIVLPTNRRYGWDTWSGVKVVVHELGHVLHNRLGEDWVADPVTRYAEVNRYEAFAEAFAAWVWGDQVDERTTALLNHVAHRRGG